VRVPWCDDCSKFWNAPELTDGVCPTCGQALAVPERHGSVAPALPTGQTQTTSGPVRTGPGAKAKGAPWHFKLLVVGVTVYMIYRIYWLAVWLPKHL
jgi:hypothetical protein